MINVLIKKNKKNQAMMKIKTKKKNINYECKADCNHCLIKEILMTIKVDNVDNSEIINKK